MKETVTFSAYREIMVNLLRYRERWVLANEKPAPYQLTTPESNELRDSLYTDWLDIKNKECTLFGITVLLK